MAARYTCWARKVRSSHRGGEDAYAKGKRRQCLVWLGKEVVGENIELKDRRKKGTERERLRTGEDGEKDKGAGKKVMHCER